MKMNTCAKNMWPRGTATQARWRYEKKKNANKKFTHHLGGNLVDGLPPSFILGPEHNFSHVELRFLKTLTNIFNGNIFCPTAVLFCAQRRDYHSIWLAGRRERVMHRFAVM